MKDGILTYEEQKAFECIWKPSLIAIVKSIDGMEFKVSKEDLDKLRKLLGKENKESIKIMEESVDIKDDNIKPACIQPSQ